MPRLLLDKSFCDSPRLCALAVNPAPSPERREDAKNHKGIRVKGPSRLDLFESFRPHLAFGLLAVALRVLAPLLKQLRDQPCPAGLMAGSDTGAVVAVEIFMEERELVPLRVALELFGVAKYRTAALAVL